MNQPFILPADVVAELRRVRWARRVHLFCAGVGAFTLVYFLGQLARWAL